MFFHFFIFSIFFRIIGQSQIPFPSSAIRLGTSYLKPADNSKIKSTKNIVGSSVPEAKNSYIKNKINYNENIFSDTVSFRSVNSEGDSTAQSSSYRSGDFFDFFY